MSYTNADIVPAALRGEYAATSTGNFSTRRAGTVSETVEAYDRMLDEGYGPVLIAGLTLYASDVLAECDPVAYKCGWIDWCDAEGIDTDELEDDYTFNRDRF